MKVFSTLVASAAMFVATQMAGAAIVYDGTINAGETIAPGNGGAWGWSTAVATSSGGPTPGFGAGHEINALYVAGDTTAPSPYVSFGIAGNVQNGNRILLFIDSKAGGYSDGSFGRTSAPEGIDNWNGSSTFDSGFLPDYALVIGTDGSNYYFDLFTLSATGSSVYLGDSGGGADNAAVLGIGANPANSSNTRGFEIGIKNTALGYTGGDMKVFAAYISDGGYLSNQFLTHADSSQGNFTGGSVNFGNEPPNPVTLPAALVPEPSSLALLGLGGLMVARRRRK